MNWTITICDDNDAFADEPAAEIARILRELADDFESDPRPRKVRDVNGNTVGAVTCE